MYVRGARAGQGIAALQPDVCSKTHQHRLWALGGTGQQAWGTGSTPSATSLC